MAIALALAAGAAGAYVLRDRGATDPHRDRIAVAVITNRTGDLRGEPRFERINRGRE